MRVTTTAAAGLVAITLAAQSVGVAGLAVETLLAVPQAIVLKGGIIALIVVLKLVKKLKEAREERRQNHAFHAFHAPNMPYALRHMHKRSTGITPDDYHLTETLQKGDEVEEVLEEAILNLIERLDDNTCLLKLLCHLQEKPQGTLTPEEGQLVDLFPAGVSGCREELQRCSVEEAQLVEAFKYTWQLQNVV